jgi:hypothetical protein
MGIIRNTTTNAEYAELVFKYQIADASSKRLYEENQQLHAEIRKLHTLLAQASLSLTEMMEGRRLVVSDAGS